MADASGQQGDQPLVPHLPGRHGPQGGGEGAGGRGDGGAQLDADLLATGDFQRRATELGVVLRERLEVIRAELDAPNVPLGIMIEVPSAAVMADQFAKYVDFFSIGTNDLSQYTMAADRMEGELAALLSPWQPAVLAMIRETCRGGNTTNKPIGVCGEAGGDPAAALVLVGLGVKSLSMAPGKVNAVRAALALHDLETCQKMAEAALDARTAAEAREAVLALADPVLKDLL